MKLPIIIIVLFILLLASTPVPAQSASELGLVLTGKHLLEDKVIDRHSEIYFQCGFRMTVENKGKEPVIIINPTLGYGTGLIQARFLFKDYYTGASAGSSLKTFEPDSTKTENFNSMAQYFTGEKPPENMTIVLAPGEKFPFEQRFLIESSVLEKGLDDVAKNLILGKSADGRHQRALDHYARRGVPFESVMLTYEYSFLTQVPDPNFLEKTSQRWKRFGRLPVGTNGTYTITSEPITNNPN